MTAVREFTHKFVDFIPTHLDDGIIYVSLTYATVIHLCACGCRTKVVCVLSPTDYTLAYDGETVTLWPSIGNWDFYCRSHYFISNGHVRWARDMSDVEIAAGRRIDRETKKDLWQATRNAASKQDLQPPVVVSEVAQAERRSAWRRIARRFTSLLH
jgi:hypothetical protein